MSKRRILAAANLPCSRFQSCNSIDGLPQVGKRTYKSFSIELAKRLSGKIVTNDFNLNKVAQLRGIYVLNINELANSLKPVVLPGEVMRVFVLKEGKEAGQGVGYLDDGTMVVVEAGRDRVLRAKAPIDVVSRAEGAAPGRVSALSCPGA